MRWSDMDAKVVAEQWLKRREILKKLNLPPDEEFEMELEDLLGKPLPLDHYVQNYFYHRFCKEIKEISYLPAEARFDRFKFYADLSDRLVDMDRQGQMYLNGALSALMEEFKLLSQENIVEAAEILYHKFYRAMEKDGFHERLDAYLDTLVDSPIAKDVKELQKRLFQSTLNSALGL